MTINQATKEIFKILQSYNYTVQLFDENGAAVQDVEDARRMYIKSSNMLVSIKDDGENSSVTLQIGNSVNINSIEGLIQSLRTTCTLKHILNFGIKRYNGKINPKSDINETIKRGKQEMDIFEGLYGTSKSSYLKLENAKIIVKHSKKVDDSKHGARTRCIESIFIENSNGERMLFPTKSLLPARAMAQHVSMGGGFHDAVAEQITRMARDFSNLATCSGHVLNNGEALPESAQTVREACKKKMNNMRKTFEKMSRPHGYTIEAAKIIEMANALLENEDAEKIDPEKIEEVRSMIALEGVSFSDDLIESVCRAIKDEGENELTEEEEDSEVAVSGKAPRVFDKELTPANSVSVLGKRIKTQVFADLAAGKIQLLHKVPPVNIPPNATKSQELVLYMHEVIPLIADDSLMNLASYITDELEASLSGGLGLKAHGNAERLDKIRKLCSAILSAAGIKRNIPSKVPAVVEYFKWFDKLNTNSILVERDIPPRHLMGDNPMDDEEENENKREAAIKFAIDDFDIKDFCETYIEENGLNDDSFDVEERVVDKDDLLNAIENHLLYSVSKYDDGDITPPSDMMSEAKELLPDVLDCLELKGFSINEDVDEEFDPFSDDSPDDNADLHHMLRSLSYDDDGGEEDVRDLDIFEAKKKRI